MRTGPTAETMRKIASKLRAASDELERHADDLNDHYNWDAPSEALNTLTNLMGNLGIDQLMTETVREFQRQQYAASTGIGGQGLGLSESPVVITDFDALQNGCKALVRKGRYGETQIDWQEPIEAVLDVRKNARGRTCGIALADRCFAEFDPNFQAKRDGTLIAKEYTLQILRVLC